MPDFRNSGPHPNRFFVEATKTFYTAPLNIDRAYSVEHLSINNLGGGDTNPVILVTSGNAALMTAPNNYNVLDNSCLLMTGRVITIGPGVQNLIAICVSGTPLLNVLPTEPFFGRF